MVAMRVRISRSALSCHGGIGIRAGFRFQCHRHVGSTPTGSIFGDLAERIIATVLKIVGRKAPGFESLSLRFMVTSKKADKSLLFVF